MGVDYIAKLIHKNGKKKEVLGKFFINRIKSIFDYYDRDFIEFTSNTASISVKDFKALGTNLEDKITNKEHELEILKMKELIAKSREIKEDIHEDISFSKEYLTELGYARSSYDAIMGVIEFFIEDQIYVDDQKNGKFEYAGTKYNFKDEDFYLEITANY